jgi:threonine dehydratase
MSSSGSIALRYDVDRREKSTWDTPVARMRALSADVRLAGADFDAAKEQARCYAAQHGLRFIEDGRAPAIAEGAGTIGLELCRWPEPIDAVIVPVGNGALISGVGRWLRGTLQAVG